MASEWQQVGEPSNVEALSTERFAPAGNFRGELV
jgi:hypothetical protein